MRKTFIFSILFTVTAFATPGFGQEGLGNRLQLEGNFATIFEDDVGYNVNLNYTPPFPGVLGGIFSLGVFWQWTFDADDLANDLDVMKLGGDLRLQRAFGPFVPYVKGEAAWVRFDNSDSVDKFGIGPGAGLNYWFTPNLGVGAEVNYNFILDDDNAPDDDIFTFMIGPRIGLGGWGF